MPRLDEAFAGPLDLALGDGGPDAWRAGLAEELYGPIPPAPASLTVARHALPGEEAERLVLAMEQDGRAFTVDAALWLPRDAAGPVPLICGLDFVGPAGLMYGDAFPLDPAARVYSRPEYGAGGRLTETLRGAHAARWPVPMLLKAGFGVLVSCYGSWVPDDPGAWRSHGAAPLTGVATGLQTGAISLWAWALSRLVDVAQDLPEVDAGRLWLAGHSRLGKAALWCAAHEARVAGVFAHAPGCGGSSPAAHPVGETLARMAAHFPHWLRPGFDAAAPRRLDQQHLLAAVAPRGLYISCGRDDLWADPLGSYAALRAAAPAWASPAAAWPDPAALWAARHGTAGGPAAFALRDGGHDFLPADWRGFLARHKEQG
jgi:dienelactone hydrolase